MGKDLQKVFPHMKKAYFLLKSEKFSRNVNTPMDRTTSVPRIRKEVSMRKYLGFESVLQVWTGFYPIRSKPGQVLPLPEPVKTKWVFFS